MIGFKAKRKIRFHNGYGKNAPSFIAVCTLDIGEGRPEWGAQKGKDYYILKIVEVMNEDLQGESQAFKF